MKENKFTAWVKAHKKELIIAGVVVVGTVLVVKNRNAIASQFKDEVSMSPEPVIIEPVVNQIIVPTISSDILNNLTGNMRTARALGHIVGLSAQEINKRIVAAGLAVKVACGEYLMTDLGSQLGKNTWKVTAAGHSFSNIEWDEKILEIIFSPEELIAMAERYDEVKQMLAA